MARLSDVFLQRDRINDAQEWMNIRKGVRFLVRSATYEPYQEYINNAPDNMNKEESEKYYRDAIAIYLWLDWDGLDDGECTLETRKKTLDDYIEIASFIVGFASNPANFVSCNKKLEDELGN